MRRWVVAETTHSAQESECLSLGVAGGVEGGECR
jgi:hypothetical protein